MSTLPFSLFSFAFPGLFHASFASLLGLDDSDSVTTLDKGLGHFVGLDGKQVHDPGEIAGSLVGAAHCRGNGTVLGVASSNLAGARSFLPRLLSMAGCCNLKRANRS